MFLRQVADHSLAQYAYLIGCQRTGEAVVIDPERDVDRYLELARENGLGSSQRWQSSVAFVWWFGCTCRTTLARYPTNRRDRSQPSPETHPAPPLAFPARS